METNGRRRWTAGRKAEVVLEGLQGKTTVVELCRKHGITQSLYYEWKELFVEKGMEGLTYGGRTRDEYEKDKRIAQLERKIGSLLLDMEVLKKLEEIRTRKKRCGSYRMVESL